MIAIKQSNHNDNEESQEHQIEEPGASKLGNDNIYKH